MREIIGKDNPRGPSEISRDHRRDIGDGKNVTGQIRSFDQFGIKKPREVYGARTVWFDQFPDLRLFHFFHGWVAVPEG